MKAELVEIDSRVFGRNVISIQDFEPMSDFGDFERCYVASFDPVYASCKIPMERVNDTHILEDAGFRLIEFQLRMLAKLRKPFDVSPCPYDYERVTTEEGLKEVLDIAGTTFVHDRFSVDRLLDPGISGARYQEYVRRSFHASDEAVYRLVDQSTRQTVAFTTHRYVGSDDVLHLLVGVHPEMKNLGLGVINESFELNDLIRKGFKRVTTHISAANYPIFKIFTALGFRILTSFAVMRKVYPWRSGGTPMSSHAPDRLAP